MRGDSTKMSHADEPSTERLVALSRSSVVRTLVLPSPVWMAVAVLSCMLMVGSLCAAPAFALQVHVFERSFGEPGSGPGQLKEPVGVAVNDSTSLEPTSGNVYVVDKGNNRVERFSSSGVFLGQFNGSGTYEVEGKVETSAPAPTGAFSEPTQIAVDDSGSPLDPSAGDVYVIDQQHAVVDKFSSTGAYIGQIDGSETKEGRFNVSIAFGARPLTGVAVAPSGALWIGIYDVGVGGSGGGPELFNFSDGVANKLLAEVKSDFSNAGQFGLDGEGDIFTNLGSGGGDGGAKLSDGGKTLRHPFGNPNGGRVGSVAVDSTRGEVYLDYGTTVEAFDLEGKPIESSENDALAAPFGSGHVTNSAGMAVNASNATVYASSQGSDIVAAFNAVTLPGVTIGVSTNRQPRSLTFNGTVDPEGKAITRCMFEYDTRPYVTGEAAHGTSVACSPANQGSGTSPVSVSANVVGLTPQRTYYYRLAVENEAGRSATPGQELFTGPILGGEFVTEVASGSSTLNAHVDPNGGDTHYYFEYGPSASYGSEVPVAAPGVDIGSLSGFQDESFHLQDLQSDVTYHYRLVVSQGGEVFAEQDRTFTTQPTGGQVLSLPDGRAWELVSLPNKKAANIDPGSNYWLTEAASDGSGITYKVNEPFGEGEQGRIFWAQALSTRTASGWRTQDVSGRAGLPPEGQSTGELFGAGELWHVFSPDLSFGLLQPGSGEPVLQSPEATEHTLYVRDNSTGGFQPLETSSDVSTGVKFGDEEMLYLTGTPDLSHIVFGTWLALTPDAKGVELCKGCRTLDDQNLYEWHEGHLELVNVLPNGSSKPGALVGSFATSLPLAGMTAHAISGDGRWVVWHYGEPPLPVSLYVRDMVEKRTLKVGGSGARFETMSSDGSKIFYVETEEGYGGDLHVYEPATETDVDLTADHGAGEHSAGVQDAILGSSQDGSYVYFVATGALDGHGVSGEDNLYMLHDGENGWTTNYIATLSKEDRNTWSGQEGTSPNSHGEFISSLPHSVTSEVSPNGRFVAFMSDRSLTGYDNVDAVSGQRDEEVFLYDATLNRLVCASCNPTGARPTGVLDQGEANGAETLVVDLDRIWTQAAGANETNHWLAGSLVGWNNEGNVSSYEPRYVMDDGRLLFNSPDALVPQDTNGLEDVYQYEPAGVGGCGEGGAGFSEVSGGCVNLISSGQSSQESAFMDASEGGNDVFFVTSSKLVSVDYDNAYDVYDAHVCTSSVPCRSEPVSPPECTSGDSCKAAPTPQPTLFGPSPSATFKGVGNVTPVPQASVEPKALSRAALLSRALRACRHGRSKHVRRVCERRVKRRYGVTRTGLVSKSSGGSGR
jgi:hypothetical protein